MDSTLTSFVPHRSRGPVRRRAAGALAVLVGALLLAIAIPGGVAEAQTGERISGRLSFEGEGVAGVRMTVTDTTSGSVLEATSDGEGRWAVELPSPGLYRVEIDISTLPEGVGLRDPERTSLEVRVLENASSAAIFALGEAAEVASDTLRRILQNSLNGLKFGLIIGITSVGLSLIFGTTGLVNFAHGDLVTIGAFTAFFLNVGLGLPLLVAAPIAVVIGGALAGGLDRMLWRPLRKQSAGLVSMLVVSIGLAFVLRHIVLLLFGGSRLAYADYSLQSAMRFGLIRVQPVELWVMGLSILLLVGVGLMLTTTRLGKSMRAVADNRDLAESSGIDVQRVILSVWVLGGALTAVGGVFLGVIESVDYLMGFRLLLLMFAGVILGGLGSAYGAMLGGLVVGFVSEVSTVWFSSQIKYVWALLVLIIILLVRPQGILGRRERFG